MFQRFPAGERGEQTGKTEDMIQVAVCDQDVIQPAKAQSRPEYLALGSLTTINQEPLITVADDLRGEAAVNGRRGGRCAKKSQFEQ